MNSDPRCTNDSSFYELLEVQPSASLSEIRRAYQKKALQYHPDKIHGQEAMFSKIQEAYEVLANDSKREIYDQKVEVQRRVLVWQEVSVDELEVLEEGSEVHGDHQEKNDLPPEQVYQFPCRCGDIYEIQGSDLEEGFQEFGCNGCSLHIKILPNEQSR
mmetsp:Transcript_25902/g.32291  ORF Transcript_25902/g.32291 Transcript_25902/m.32291 type:complete len:159 (+) Transcript_25902:119-595(+)